MTAQPQISPQAVGALLASAGAVMRSMPRGCTADQVEAARMAWAWLALLDPDVAQIVEARAATGAGWAAIGRQFDLTPAVARAVHDRGLTEIAARLRAAMRAG